VVEQGTHKPLVGGSNPPSATNSPDPGPMSALCARLEASLGRLGVADGAPLILAVSGGPDSMALLHVSARAAPRHGWRLIVAHLDHGLREDSADDAQFVTDAASRLGLEAKVSRTDVAALAAERGDGIEEAGRMARYAFLEEVAAAAGSDAVILTAHSADDQAETVLLHLARGTGLTGLSGIAERRGRVVRPLLGVRRPQLRAALDEAGVHYRVDPSNDDRRFSRNRARAELLPAFEELHGRAIEGVGRMASQAASDDGLLDALALTVLAARRSADGWIDWRPEPPPAIAARVVRAAVGAPAPSTERTEAIVAAASRGRGGRVIELGGGRRAVLRAGRVRVVHTRVTQRYPGFV
jgi:tRNA(Ile)-lysidine synthase